MRQHCGDEGVSEVVAAVLLVGLTVLGVAIVAAIFLSSPQPDEIPHTAIVAGNRSGNFALTHEGGDSLKVGEYRIYIDTGNGLMEMTSDFSEPEGGIWSVGESINYTGTEVLKRVVVTVISGNSETILSEPAFVQGGMMFGPDPVVSGGTNGDDEPEVSFIDFIINENVFVYGSALKLRGSSNVNGPGATVVITEGLNSTTLEGGNAFVAVSTIYIDGDVILEDGSASLGLPDNSGTMYINGNLTLGGGKRNIYGDVYVAGDFSLKDARIHRDVYVDGDLTLNWTPWIADDAHIYYTGTITAPPNYSSNSDAANILAKCIKRETVPKVQILDLKIPSTKSAKWYEEKNYIFDPIAPLTSNMKIFAPSYTSSVWKPEATNIIIIACTGDITITGLGGSGVTGVFFAPNGKVTFEGAFLEGVVIARDGFYVTSGGTKVTFKNIQEYISDPEDYPF